MSSYISHFKAWIIAALLIVAFEAAFGFAAAPNPFDRTNFLPHTFGRPEPMQRLYVFHKLRAFIHSEPTIVQSGDSSGFFGIEPSVVMKHLPAGVSYLNLSCCANLGYKGYYNILELMAQHNKSIRYMVLHVTPYTMPRPEMWDVDGANIWGIPGLEVFGNAVDQEFVSPRALTHPPSLGYRRQVADAVYYLTPMMKYLGKVTGQSADQIVLPPGSEQPVDFLRTLLLSKPYLEFLRDLPTSRGWAPEIDIRDGVYASECDIPTPEFFDVRTLSHKTYLKEVLDEFTALAKCHGLTLVVVFQPVACVMGTGALNVKARTIIGQFKSEHPEVEIPFPLIETWPVDIFSVPAHVRHEHTDLIGNRLGIAMADIIRRRGTQAGTSQ
jgi:hypothetical protein